MPHVVIVGGGLTGLSVAFRLKQFAPHVSVTVLEPRDRAGGNIRTENHDGFRVECGPNGFLDRTPSVPNLVRDLGLSERLIAASEGSRKNRYLFLRGKLRKMPSGPYALLTSGLLSLRGKWQLFSEPWRKAPAAGPQPDESIAEFVTRRAGKEAAEIFADALVTGIHAGDPNKLSVAAAFPRLPVMEREAGSIIRGFMRAAKKRKRDAADRGEPVPGPMRMWSFREGLQALVDGLLVKVGASVRTGVRVKSVRRREEPNPPTPFPGKEGGVGFSPSPLGLGVGEGSSWQIDTDAGPLMADAVVLACPAYEQAAILAELDPAIAKLADGIAYNRIAVAALGYRQSDCSWTPDGFGYIAPQNTQRDVLGVQWCSAIFPDRAPPGCMLWRALCGGVNRTEVADWDDDTLAKAVHAEMKLAMGVRGEPVFRKIVRWPRAIPQYNIGHLDRVAKIEAAAAAHPGLFLTGNAYHGIAMGDCAEQGELVAARVAAALGAR